MANGRRNISLSKMDMTLIIEGLNTVREKAIHEGTEMGDFKADATENVISHVRNVQAKLVADMDKAEREARARR